MKYLAPTAVLLLMVSIGMSLNPRQFAVNWGKLTLSEWMRLLIVTFLLPPLLVLALSRVLPLGPAATAGLFLVAVAPGAPLLTRNAAKRGFDMQIAASYQVWGALMIPLMVPPLVAGGAWLNGRELWIPPLKLLEIIAWQQFLPLLTGIVLVRLFPDFSKRLSRGLNLAGNLLLTVALFLMLFALGPALKQISPWIALAAIALAATCLVSVLLLLPRRSSAAQTLAISNTNRHVGLALLLSGQHLHDQRPVPAIAAYALAALVVMTIFARIASRNPTTDIETS